MSISGKHVGAGLAVIGAATLAVCLASPAIFQYRTLYFDREHREFRIRVRGWVRNPYGKYDPPPIVVEDTLDTNLLRIRRRVIDVGRVDPSVRPPADGYLPGGAAMDVKGTRALIATRRGSFYEVDLDDPHGRVRKTSLVLDTGYDTLRAFSLDRQNSDNDDGTGGLRYVNVTDLMFLTDRNSLAAAYTYWNSGKECIASRVAVLDLREDWRSGHGRWHVVFESTPCIPFGDGFRGNQAGGRLVEIGRGAIYLAVGDFGRDGVTYKSLVEDHSTSYGKVIELHIDSGEHRVVSTGVRNPEGLARDARRSRVVDRTWPPGRR